ncbi:MAG: spore germination protein [Bacillota bacterium]
MKARQRRRQPVKSDLAENRQFLADEIGLGDSFDLVAKEFTVAGRDALLVGVDGFIKDGILLFIVDSLTHLSREDILPRPMDSLYNRFVGYVECELVDDMYAAADEILSGPAAIFLDGEDRCMVIDSRTYPQRAVDEPELERVMRGPRDGFVETLVTNLALLRRRVRDHSLRVKLITVGARSQTDVVVIHIQDLADPETVATVVNSIEAIDIDGISMTDKSVVEFMTLGRSRLNPFPVVRHTERPDVAAEFLFEGHVLVMIDGTPSVIMLPVTFFHHLQHAEEFHESILNGSFLRLLRYLGVVLAWIGTPVWLVMATNDYLIPDALAFIGPREPPNLPLLLQFVFGEAGIELIRMGLVHTPSALATSLGIIGAVLLGELAVEVGLFNSEVILYVVVVALAYFAIPSWELSVALRLCRIALLLIGGLLGPIGLVAGLVLNVLLLAFTRSWGVPYLWPVIPFNWNGFTDVIYRRPVTAHRRRPSVLHPGDPTRGS